MVAIMIYVALVVMGQVVAFFLGGIFDRMVPPAWSMIVYMGLFFGVIAVMWPIAVWITEKWFVKAEQAK